MFPHPMYTVGYAFYYGSSIISRSYTVFYVSFIAHMMQLAFLTFVENPRKNFRMIFFFFLILLKIFLKFMVQIMIEIKNLKKLYMNKDILIRNKI